MQNGAADWEAVWTFLKKLSIEPPYAKAIPLLGTHTPKRKESRVSDRYLLTHVHSSVFTMAKGRSNPSVH